MNIYIYTHLCMYKIYHIKFLLYIWCAYMYTVDTYMCVYVCIYTYVCVYIILC